MKSPIIERPDLQSPQQRTLFGLLTLIFWVFWFYLWVPLLALLAWALGIQQAFKYMVVLGGFEEVVRVIGVYSLVILMLGGGLVLWAFYNILRFRGIEKRTASLPVTNADIGREFGQDPFVVLSWQDKKMLSVSHDESGRITNVEVLNGAEAVPV
ncbi:MAG TPA: poly-beta-1,6-N-acetyl-D-glucosamine biosynthesis protein PgaD [Rhodocyclaceae bacterium]|jgi:biofilm PGA synthesis protein PgaD|nr:poly-beta-1,6-N-acetyl-D-glucosamine biosynthesis protein PgaD [Rhodocyclaceae bacterium]